MNENQGHQSVQIINRPNDPQETHLPSSSQAPTKSNNQLEPVGFFKLFRFAETFDYVLMAFGTLMALSLGAALPTFVLLWGNMTNAFGQGPEAIVEASRTVLFQFIYLAIGVLFAGWIMISFWMIAGERQAVKCRQVYFQSLLQQEIGWFDCIDQSELSTNFTTDTFAFQGGIGEKVATLIQLCGVFIGGFAIAFYKGWLMTLVIVATLPLTAIAGYFYISIVQARDSKNKQFYAQAGALSEQAIYSIKTIKQLNGEQFEQIKYNSCLQEITSKAIRFAIFAAIALGAMSFSSMISYSLGFWFGSNCLEKNSSCPPNVAGISSPGDVLVVFFGVLVAGLNLSQLSPSLNKIAEGKQAAARIFKIIDRKPLIVNPLNGLKPGKFKGHIDFKSVTFAYPKDKSKTILENLSLSFTTSSTALVGQSGCGKSTILQLLMRFYDPDQGTIQLDGNDLRTLDLQWLRQQIGYVGQEPVLFASSIRQNLMLGNENATTQDLNDALKQAEAYQFVYQLQEKLQTFVGLGGGQISGGQKQRLAIARALLKKPKLLLLDEATSALDRRNERLIQNTLNKISKGLTTITVAHRVKTIMNSQRIYVLNKGTIQQAGTFESLKRYKGIAQQHDTQEMADNDDQVKMEVGKKIGQGGILDLVNIRGQQTVVLSKEEKQKQRKAKLIEKHQKNIYRRIFTYNKAYIGLFIFGIIVSLLNGLVYPCFSVFLSQMIDTFFMFSTNPTQARSQANTFSLVFLLLAFGSFVASFLQSFTFSVIGQQITRNIRIQTYNKILKMPIPWFDHPQNSCGTLASRLALDCQSVNGMITTYVSIMLQCLTTLIAGITVALIFEWRTALVAIAFIPLMIISGAIRTSFRAGLANQGDKAYKQSSNIIMQSLVNIRTVVSFGVENTVMNKYKTMLTAPYRSMIITGVLSGFLFGLSQFLTNLSFALIFYFGTLFVRDFGANLLNVFTAIYSIFFAAITVGNNSHFMPDIAQTKLAGASIFEILDAEDEQQLQTRQQSKMLTTGIKGNIELTNLSFKYQSRNETVFKHLNISIQKGQKIAFVGPSGCGKSTIMQLLQRFYFKDEGTIVIDGEDIKDYEIHYLRSVFGVVSQEPTLFNGTFRDNIKYNLENATDEEIKAAANEANALAFIEGTQKMQGGQQGKQEHSSNNGFDQNVGIKGSHISGGQKQRVAIARAILRKPTILLLDEATSALDSNNERKVQQSLDRIMGGKTTISIAHRIDTIKNSNEILVFEKGQIAERGTYEELIAKKGFFFNLERGTQFV